MLPFSAPYGDEHNEYIREYLILDSLERDEHRDLITAAAVVPAGTEMSRVYNMLLELCMPWLHEGPNTSSDGVYADLMARYKAFKERVEAGDGGQTQLHGHPSV